MITQTKTDEKTDWLPWRYPVFQNPRWLAPVVISSSNMYYWTKTNWT